MTTVSEAVRVASTVTPPVEDPHLGVQRRDVQTGRRAKASVTDRDGGVLSRLLVRLRAVHAVAWADLSQAWVWRGTPPTLRDLWLARIPALEQVPGRSTTLRAGWVVWNHAVLPTYAAVSVALWVLMHPARFGLALAAITPLAFMWISG